MNTEDRNAADANSEYSAFDAGQTGHADNERTSECRYAGVALIDVPQHLDRSFDYYIIDDLVGLVQPGDFVSVPFGSGNSKRLGIVFSVKNTTEFLDPSAIKPILWLYPKCMSLGEDMVKLSLFMRENTFCTVGDAVHSIVPSAFFAKGNFFYKLSDDGKLLLSKLKKMRKAAIVNENVCICGDSSDMSVDRFEFLDRPFFESMTDRSDYTFEQESIYALLSLIGRVDRPISLAKILSKLGEELVPKLAVLEDRKLVSVEFSMPAAKPSSQNRVSLAISDEEADGCISELSRAPVQAAVIRELVSAGARYLDELQQLTGAAASVIYRLENKGIVKIEKVDRLSEEEEENEDEQNCSPPDDNTLAGEQVAAFDDILGLLNSGEAKAALLHGVTGSGKTRVIKAACDEVISRGKAVIILLPEISLTPQILDYFKRCYGERICVIHSLLSVRQRSEAWKRIKQGEIDICIGTRSAVFAPFSNLGMIVIDEEQEHTYKSDISPKYNAKDIARFRCAKAAALMLLSSATPSVESYYKAVNGVYKLIEINHRYGGTSLPETVISDIRPCLQSGKIPIGDDLDREIRLALERGKQIILFLNRRGYNNYISCPQCGEAVKCPNCSVSLTYHTDKRNGSGLICHWCGHKQAPPEKCPSCGGSHMIYIGYGIQKIEEELSHRYGNAVIMRMDADTASEKSDFDSIIEKFRAGDADILLGTQMVTKGHDFPNVELSGVIFADFSLFLDDYRSNERTFSMITQLVGRSGRNKSGGKAVIQTASPSNPVIKLAAAQDYKSFYESEIALRRAMLFPPFCRIAVINFVSENAEAAKNTAKSFNKRFGELIEGEFSDVRIYRFGPYEAPVYRVNKRYRYRILCKTSLDKRARALLHTLLGEFSLGGHESVSVGIDIDPSSV